MDQAPAVPCAECALKSTRPAPGIFRVNRVWLCRTHAHMRLAAEWLPQPVVRA